MIHPSINAEANRADRFAVLRAVALTAICFIATLYFFWSGIGANDSDKYIGAALHWLEQGPHVGGNHWALRGPLVAPMAASFALFGPGEFAATLPNILYAAGLVAVTFFYARKHLGEAAGVASAILVATSAFFVVAQSEVSATGPEALFVVLGGWLFIDASRSGRLAVYGAAGLCAGGAWLCRESALFLPLTFGLLLIGRRPFSLAPIAAMSAGFAIVIGAELIFYWFAAGDPLHRFDIDFRHRGPGYIDRDKAMTESGLLFRLTLPLKHLLSDPATTPFLMLGAAAFLSPGFRRAIAAPPLRRTAVVFGAASAVGFLLTAYAFNMKSPTYYPIVAYVSLLALGVFVGRLWDARRIGVAVGALAGLVALNAAAADFRRYDEHAEARWLARYLLQSGETVTTDQVTAVRTRLFLRLEGLTESETEARVISILRGRPASCGLVYAATPSGLNKAIAPQADWREIASTDVRRKPWTHTVLRALGAGAASPRLVAIVQRTQPAALYEAPRCQEAGSPAFAGINGGSVTPPSGN